MKLNLIPQPQYAQGREGDAVNLSNLDATLVLPAPDTRLSSLTGSLFHLVEEVAWDKNIFALAAGGAELNPAQAERVRGRHDGYVLMTGGGQVELYACSASGLFYGLKTLERVQATEDNGLVPALVIVDWADLALRSDYLDLRTLYPTFDHMLNYIAELADYKLNTLVIEYEDKLPFHGDHTYLRHPRLCLSEEQHRQLLETAWAHFISVIPKQQSFGHLEYILKHPANMSLRETPDSVGELCPHRPGAYELMAGILSNVADLHPDSDYLHLGCDEVWSLGTCEDCRRSGMSREASFISFVNRLAHHVRSLGKKPMIWHDMLIHASSEELKRLDKGITIVVWIYGGHQMKADARRMIRSLRETGLAVLGASAVRCWDDNGDQNYPVIHNRIANIQDWSEMAESEQLDGVIATNWACPFALGSPYGLFETSRYPAFYSAERSWNSRADDTSYLQRFLLHHHGLQPSDVSEPWDDYASTDYYQLMPRLLPYVRKNRDTAELISAMIAFELPAHRQFPLHTWLFRAVLHGGSEEISTGLKARHRSGFNELKQVRIRMKDALDALLIPEMRDVYLMSRFYRPELYERHLSEIVEGVESVLRTKEGENDHA
ncbi:family 20 glycosylhydrolase [Paenibacillus daejeonensis]|uniref:family 20 glycosylhydrolase n=1 Tax=Paenibacillus daejeonensis TaxID=135193 RepID=UPI00035C542B|nr:family 20 glycosylhydrolase [Paenibacillus daejeonensis]